MKNILNTQISIDDIIALISSKNSIVKKMDLHSLVGLYLKMREFDIRVETKNCYKLHLDYLLDFFDTIGVKNSSDINQNTINQFVAYSTSKGNKAITINKRLAILHTMLKYCAEREIISMPAYKFVKLKEQPSEIKTITLADAKAIYDYLPLMNERNRLIFLLFFQTGIRRNELINIKVNNIDFEKMRILLETTKNGKNRYCYFDEETKILINDVINKNKCRTNPYLFALGNGHIDKIRINTIFFEVKKKLGIKSLSPHKIRHFYATQLLKNGADINTVRKLLGHSKLETTQRYLDYTDEFIQENNYKFNPMSNLK